MHVWCSCHVLSVACTFTFISTPGLSPGESTGHDACNYELTDWHRSVGPWQTSRRSSVAWMSSSRIESSIWLLRSDCMIPNMSENPAMPLDQWDWFCGWWVCCRSWSWSVGWPWEAAWTWLRQLDTCAAKRFLALVAPGTSGACTIVASWVKAGRHTCKFRQRFLPLDEESATPSDDVSGEDEAAGIQRRPCDWTPEDLWGHCLANAEVCCSCGWRSMRHMEMQQELFTFREAEESECHGDFMAANVRHKCQSLSWEVFGNDCSVHLDAIDLKCAICREMSLANWLISCVQPWLPQCECHGCLLHGLFESKPVLSSDTCEWWHIHMIIALIIRWCIIRYIYIDRSFYTLKPGYWP